VLTSRWREAGETIAIVPTMGALHRGHLALVDTARTVASRVVVTIFVNPLQFGEDEDFARYPRDIHTDVKFLEGHGVDVVFAPDVSTVYPDGTPQTLRSSGLVGETFEGVHRPGHFDGVLTVVSRLFDLVSCDHAVFGKKDAQQLHLVTAMAKENPRPITIHEVDTVRDEDGLALSSRNVYLSDHERQVARVIPRALKRAKEARTPEGAVAAAKAELEGHQELTVEYVEVVDRSTFLPVTSAQETSDAVLILAVKVGSTRLIDNEKLEFDQ
jgi:pantoate--beta-alanine ligase